MNASLFYYSIIYYLVCYLLFYVFLKVNIYGYLVIFQWTHCSLSCLNLSVIWCLLLLSSSRVFIYRGQIYKQKFSMFFSLWRYSRQPASSSFFMLGQMKVYMSLFVISQLMHDPSENRAGSTTAASGLCYRKADGLKELLIPDSFKNLDAFGKKRANILNFGCSICSFSDILSLMYIHQMLHQILNFAEAKAKKCLLYFPLFFFSNYYFEFNVKPWAL